MKKRSCLALLAVLATLCVAFLLAGCGPFATVNYKLYFRVDGDVYATISTSGDEVISIPDDPVKEGYTFDGWYWDKDVWEKPFTANSLLDAPISSNMSVYAKFTALHEHEPSQNWSYDAETHWKDCSCGEQFETGEHVWSQWTVETPATEEEAGLEVRTCTVCGQREQRTLSQLPHTHSYTIENPSEQYLKTPADCYGGAVYYKSCSCGEKGTETFTYGDPVHQYSDTVHQPTCDSDGYTYHECEICGDSYSDNHVDHLDHNVEYHGMKSPTCLEAGNSEYWSCLLCHKLFADRECTEPLSAIPVIEATGHSYASDWDHDKNYHWKNAICEHVEEKGFMALHDYDETYTCRTCGYEDTGVHGTDVLPATLHKEGETLSLVIANAVTTYSLRNEFTVADGAVVVLASNVECTQQIVSMTVSLDEGDNVYYLLVTNGDDSLLYTITIRRRPMYTVSFDTDGGTPVPEQRVEEGSLAEEPSTEKTGYHFEGWDHVFSEPIMQDTNVKARWSANKNTKYTVEYYLENLEDDGFTLRESVICYGETDSRVKAEIKTYDHFTVREDNVEGTVSPDGTAVLKVYYKRDVYTVTFEGGGGARTGGGEEIQQVKYLGSATPPVYSYRGYNFTGFNGSYMNISASVTLTAQWSEIAKQNYDMSNVRFADSAVTYDGQEHSIYITFTQGGLPAGVSVRYENNGQTDAGEYTVTAIFTGNEETHNPIPVMTAKLTIHKAKIDMANVIFVDQRVEYDGELHSITVKNLPKELNEEDITYYYNGQEGTGVSEPGEYTVIAVFREIYNYENIEKLTATLTIFITTYEDKYEQYSELGRTIDLIHADSITDIMPQSIFSDKLYMFNVNRDDKGEQYNYETSVTDMETFYGNLKSEFELKVNNQAGGNIGPIMMNTSASINTSASFEAAKKQDTSVYGYLYYYVNEAYRVSIQDSMRPEKFMNILSDSFLQDINAIRSGSLSAERFIARWGTHVIMSAIYGERVEVSYTGIKSRDYTKEEIGASLESQIGASMKASFGEEGVNASSSTELETAIGSTLEADKTHVAQELRIKVLSKLPFGSAGVASGNASTEFTIGNLSGFSAAYSQWMQNHAGIAESTEYAVFSDVPDGSLYCIWELLGDEYQDVKDILNEYMYSQCSELFNSKVNAINSNMLADDVEFDKETQVFTVNLAPYQGQGSLERTLEKPYYSFDATNYDKEVGALKVYPAIGGVKVKKIILNGAYEVDDSQGQAIEKLIDKFYLKFEDGNWLDEIEIVLNHVGFNAGDNLSAFDFSQVSKNLNVIFTVNGTNEILGGNGTSAGSAINAEHLNLTIQSLDPTASLTLRGGNGVDGANPGESGTDGGTAVIVETLTVNSAGNLFVYGGNGGNGAAGETTKTDGGNGGNGGNGGIGIFASDLLIKGSGQNYIFAGCGGAGGAGGDQENVPSKRPTEGGNGRPSKGTTGYAGGMGGNGGNSGHCISILTISCEGNLTLNEGDSGNGGSGGKGGKGGTGGNSSWWLGNVQGGDGGIGGKGGNGGNGGKILDAIEVRENGSIDGSDVTINAVQPNGGGGIGGDGGDGGDGGKNEHYNWYGKTGDVGDSGTDGAPKTHE